YRCMAGDWSPAQLCGATSCDPASGSCNNASLQCIEGRRACGSGNSYVCMAGKLMLGERCSGGCNDSTGFCNGGPQCVDGTFRCTANGNSERCVNGSWGMVTCPMGCQQGTGQCNTCVEGETRCTTGTTTERCSGGTW